jgi:D-aminoacyl-tRNA deacylase
MIALLQRVSRASVSVESKPVSAIEHGLLILLGVAAGDEAADAAYLAKRTAELRIFPDEEERMNLSLLDTGGSALVVSQFTLLADTSRGRRPSYTKAALPDLADSLYLLYCSELSRLGIPVSRGVFGAMMDVELVNKGPVTIILHSKEKI